MSWLNRERLGATATFALVTAAALAARVWMNDVPLFFGIRIEVPIIALCLASIARGARFGATAGFLLGLIVDATQPEWLGASAAGYTLVGFFSGSFGQTIYVDKTRARAALSGASVLIFDACFGLLSVGIASPFLERMLASLGSAVMTAGVTALASRLWQLVFAPARRFADAAADD